MKSKFLKYIFWIFAFGFLTITTQIGGLILVLSIFISRKIKSKFISKPLVVFLVTYLFFTFLIVPFVAPLFGREKVVNTNRIKPTSFITSLLNHNYVRPEMNEVLLEVEKELDRRNSNINIQYLDANFPFLNKFPLLPHLSHHDGKKLDLSLVYETPDGEITNDKKSISGYGVFVEPTKHEFKQADFCFKQGYFQYDFSKYLTLGNCNSDLKFSKKGTKLLMKAILRQKQIGKVFIEKHLKTRMHLTDSRIRFQGCRSVRHDDHIHIQLK